MKGILRRFVRGGGSGLLFSHVMALIEEMCDTVAVTAKGKVLAEGTLEQVRGQATLEQAFVELVGARVDGEEGLSWLGS